MNLSTCQAMIRVESEKQDTVERFSHTYSSFVRKGVDWNMAKLEDYREATDIALTRAAIYWNFPKAIPHLCSLYSNLLVNSAERTMDTSVSYPRGAKSGLKILRKIDIAKLNLKNAFKKWKMSGRPRSHSNPLCVFYLTAKANLQRLTRYSENLKTINHNNVVVNSFLRDKNRIYSTMKQFHGQKSSSAPVKLQ